MFFASSRDLLMTYHKQNFMSIVKFKCQSVIIPQPQRCAWNNQAKNSSFRSQASSLQVRISNEGEVRSLYISSLDPSLFFTF